MTLVMFTFAMMAAIRVHANAVSPSPKSDAAANKDDTSAPPREPLIRRSKQEIRRIAARLARNRIHAKFVIAWSLWRRAHHAEAHRAHLKMQV